MIGDAEQVYDSSLLDDQLVLGIKGTLSAVELKVLKMRLQKGIEEKARRGEREKLLPTGFVREASGKVVKDPDERVRKAMALVFSKFRDLRSVRQTFLWFHTEGVELPVNPAWSRKPGQAPRSSNTPRPTTHGPRLSLSAA